MWGAVGALFSPLCAPSKREGSGRTCAVVSTGVRVKMSKEGPACGSKIEYADGSEEAGAFPS